MNYLDPEYQEFLRRQMLGQTEPVMLDPSLVPPEQVAVNAVAPAAEVEPEPKPMTELEQIQARIGQASAQTQDAAKQYQDWLAGLGGRFRSDMERQSQALEGASREARDMGLLHQSTGRNLALLGLKDAAQPYQQMAVQAAQIQGQAPQKQQQLFSDYLQKVAGLEGRGLESKMEMAGRLEQGARGELTKYQERLANDVRHAQDMAAKAATEEERLKWKSEEVQRDRELKLLLASMARDASAAARDKREDDADRKLDRKMFHADEDYLPTPAELTPAEISGARAAYKSTKDLRMAIPELSAMVEKLGRGAKLSPTELSRASTLANHIQLSMKGEDQYGLGVLTGPDLQLLRKAVPDPETINWSFLMQTGPTRLAQTLDNINRSYDARMTSLGFKRKSVAGSDIGAKQKELDEINRKLGE